jgi:hypothetical protein
MGIANNVGAAMRNAFQQAGLTSQQYLSKLNQEGARVISKN